MYRTFLAAVILAGSFALALSLMDLSAQPIAPQWLMLVALTGVSGWATLRLRAIPASFSISDTFTIAAALLFGPAAGAVTVAVDALVMSLRLAAGGRQPARVRVLFNVTVPPLTMWIAAQVFFTSAGVGPLAHAPGTIPPGSRSSGAVRPALFRPQYRAGGDGGGAGAPGECHLNLARSLRTAVADLLRRRVTRRLSSC